MRLRFEEGEDTSNIALNSYYNCYHEGDDNGDEEEGDEEREGEEDGEGEEKGVDMEEYDKKNEDVYPILPSFSTHHNDNCNYKNNDMNDDDDIDKDGDSDSKDEDEDEDDDDEINSVQTLRMESKVRSPFPPAFQESSLSFNTIRAIKELIKESTKEKDEERSATIHSRTIESHYNAEECSLSHDDACDKSYLEEKNDGPSAVDKSVSVTEKEKEAPIEVDNNEFDKRNDEKLIESNTHNLKSGDKDEKKDEDKSSDGDSDCDTVPSPTPPPTLSTIPPSSAARKTLSMESRDPRISLTRRVSQASLTAIAPSPVPASARSPSVSTQRTQYPSSRPIPSVIPGRALDMDKDSDSDSGSSSGSYDSSSGEDFNFNMPSAMSLQDTVRQRSKTLHSESTFLSRPSNAFKFKKKELEEEEEKVVEKSEMRRTSLKKACVAASEEVGVPCMQCQTQTHYIIPLPLPPYSFFPSHLFSPSYHRSSLLSLAFFLTHPLFSP